MGTERCWIDAYASNDNGLSWSLLSKVADTGPHNGNPPSLVRLTDGRLCCVYGNRGVRRIEARYSEDEGQTWGERIVLRHDFQTDDSEGADLGYARVVRRADGKLIAIYYWASANHREQHIAATTWDPGT